MKKYRIVDLFSGCGGISEGFYRTGKVDIVGAIDFEQSACNTYQQNFESAKVICGDIRAWQRGPGRRIRQHGSSPASRCRRCCPAPDNPPSSRGAGR